MTCEEFATAGLDLGSAGEDGPLQRAAREHLRECPQCAALHVNWLALRQDLSAIGAETSALETPSRVEMRLRQEFRSRHKTAKAQRTALYVGWSLAAAAAIAFALVWVNWRLHSAVGNLADNKPAVHAPVAITSSSGAQSSDSITPAAEVLVASNGSDFTLLPGSMPPFPEDATVVHVEMQRAALGALGLTVNEEHAGDWIEVDLLVGDDGLPQAVRLPQTASTVSN